MRRTQPICTRNGQSARLGVHAYGKGQQLLKFRPRGQTRDVTEGIKHSEGRACILDDLMGEKAGESDVVCTACCFGLASAREPFEEKDQGADGLERCKRGRIKRIEVVDDKRYTKRLEEFAAAQLQVNQEG